MAQERIIANDLRTTHFLVHEEKLGRVKNIEKSKTGKHGAMKVHVKCKDVFSGKTWQCLVGSQDMVEVIKPLQVPGYRCSALDQETGQGTFDKPGAPQISLVVPDKMMSELEDPDDRPALDCTILSFQGKHTLVRVFRAKK